MTTDAIPDGGVTQADRVALEDVNPTIAEYFASDPCLIWSGEHRWWWRADGYGYTADRARAGRYTIGDAYARTRHCDPTKAIAFERLATAPVAPAGEVERLGSTGNPVDLAALTPAATDTGPTIGAGVERYDAVGRAIENAWNGSGSDGAPNRLPPINLSDHERRHLGRAALTATHIGSTTGTGDFQARVAPWMDACFGPEISGDRVERGDRLLEEVLELLQSGGYDPARVAALTGYVWGRPAGEPAQEVGGVMVTLAAYCLAHELHMHDAGEAELARIWTKVAAIRAKQAAKPTGSALPVALTATQDAGAGMVDDVIIERSALAAWVAYSTPAGSSPDDEYDEGHTYRQEAERAWRENPEVCTHVGADGFRNCARAALAAAHPAASETGEGA
jgi:hypothetical protein